MSELQEAIYDLVLYLGLIAAGSFLFVLCYFLFEYVLARRESR